MTRLPFGIKNLWIPLQDSDENLYLPPLYVKARLVLMGEKFPELKRKIIPQLLKEVPLLATSDSYQKWPLENMPSAGHWNSWAGIRNMKLP